MDEVKKRELIAWLESMPWWKELPYANMRDEYDRLWEAARAYLYNPKLGASDTLGDILEGR